MADNRAEAERLAAQQQVLDGERARLEADRRTFEEAQRAMQEQQRALEATTIAALHTQAVAVLNIRTLIPVVLDTDSPNYTQWRGLFLLAVGKYELSDHVLSDTSLSTDPAWTRMECVVLSWIFGTISASLVQLVMSPGTTARRAWLSLEDQFLGNKETRALYLDAEFRNFTQGDLNVSDYCRRLKAMADALGDLGEPVQDRTLVLAVLRGLNERFAHLASLIRRAKPFPSFVEVRSDLLLEELTMQNRPVVAPIALVATGQPASTGRRGTNNSRNNRRGGRNTRGNSASTPAAGQRSQVAQAAPPPRADLPWNPWSGTVQIWPHPGATSILGPRPNLAPQAPTGLYAVVGLAASSPTAVVPTGYA